MRPFPQIPPFPHFWGEGHPEQAGIIPIGDDPDTTGIAGPSCLSSRGGHGRRIRLRGVPATTPPDVACPRRRHGVDVLPREQRGSSLKPQHRQRDHCCRPRRIAELWTTIDHKMLWFQRGRVCGGLAGRYGQAARPVGRGSRSLIACASQVLKMVPGSVGNARMPKSAW